MSLLSFLVDSNKHSVKVPFRPSEPKAIREISFQRTPKLIIFSFFDYSKFIIVFLEKLIGFRYFGIICANRALTEASPSTSSASVTLEANS